MLANLRHWLLMHLSRGYAIDFELVAMFAAFTEKVARLSDGKGTIKEIEVDLGQFCQNRFPRAAYEGAVSILLDADAYAANELGILRSEDKRAAARHCANGLLESVRNTHMPLGGHGDHAHWAGKKIMFIHKWLTANHQMDRRREEELKGFAKKLEWAHNLFNRDIDYWRYHRLYLLRP